MKATASLKTRFLAAAKASSARNHRTRRHSTLLVKDGSNQGLAATGNWDEWTANPQPRVHPVARLPVPVESSRVHSNRATAASHSVTGERLGVANRPILDAILQDSVAPCSRVMALQDSGFVGSVPAAESSVAAWCRLKDDPLVNRPSRTAPDEWKASRDATGASPCAGMDAPTAWDALQAWRCRWAAPWKALPLRHPFVLPTAWRQPRPAVRRGWSSERAKRPSTPEMRSILR